MSDTPEPKARAAAGQADRGAAFARLLGQWRSGAAPPLVMAVVNVTPDSFSDGGRFAETDSALAQARRLREAGAAILDIGGESTRPRATPVAEAEEKRRILPVVEALAAEGAVISVDTMKAAVADAALAAGAGIVNDIRGLQGDPHIAAVAARHGAGVVAMHNPGILGSTAGTEGDPIRACLVFFDRSLDIAARAGIGDDRIVLDPGFGFGKTIEQQLAILARLPELLVLGAPILVGASRKSFIGRVVGRDTDERLVGTLTAHVAAALAGAAVVRAHDVAEHVDAMRMVAAIRGGGWSHPAPSGHAR